MSIKVVPNGTGPSRKRGVLHVYRSVVLTSVTRRLANWISTRFPDLAARLYVTSGKDGGHATGSNHYKGLALDIASNQSDGADAMRDLSVAIYKYSAHIKEFLHSTPYSTDNGYGIKNGRRVNLRAFFGATLARQHLNHAHCAVDSAGMSWLEKNVKAAAGAPVASTPAVLKVGSKGSEVTKLQTNGNRLFPGYTATPMKVDGSFGEGTKKFVAEFQWKHVPRLAHDGTVGPVTRAALVKAKVL